MLRPIVQIDISAIFSDQQNLMVRLDKCRIFLAVVKDARY